MLILVAISFISTGLVVALLIKFRAANHTARTLLDKLKHTAEELDATKRLLASSNLTLDAMRIERAEPVQIASSNGQDSNHTPDKKKRKYYRKPKGQ